MLHQNVLTTAQISNVNLNDLAEISSRLGIEIVDIAGFLDSIEVKSQGQLSALRDLRQGADQVISSNDRVMETIETVSASTQKTLETVQTSVSFVRNSSSRSQEVAEWVQELNGRSETIGSTVNAMRKNNEMITSIAAQVNILAINAKIEAGRAGVAGRGFAVVAEAINDLSKRTQKAAEEINQNIQSLSDWIQALHKESDEISTSAKLIIDQARDTDSSLLGIEENARHVHKQSEQMLSEAAQVKEAVSSFAPNINRIGSSVQETAGGIHDTNQRVANLISSSERLVQGTVALGGRSGDEKFISFVTELAGKIGTLFESAVDRGQISQSDLFDKNYKAIPNTDPQQVMTRFTLFTDQVLSPLLETALELDSQVAFCAAVDTNGYLPTHNKKFSQPQSSDPEWNTANCRNRRIFDDRVGLKAGRSTEAFLMQVYRRDMGGGTFVMMKDLSAPISVKGRHWGGLRMGIKP